MQESNSKPQARYQTRLTPGAPLKNYIIFLGGFVAFLILDSYRVLEMREKLAFGCFLLYFGFRSAQDRLRVRSKKIN